jgi:hypothetical protein
LRILENLTEYSEHVVELDDECFGDKSALTFSLFQRLSFR